MIQWHDNARDYIARTKKAKRYVNKCEADKQATKQMRKYKQAPLILLVAFGVLVSTMIALSVPKASLDRMEKDKYEESITYVKQVEADVKLKEIEQGQ